jgi:hypothetical protein
VQDQEGLFLVSPNHPVHCSKFTALLQCSENLGFEGYGRHATNAIAEDSITFEVYLLLSFCLLYYFRLNNYFTLLQA